MTTGTAHGAYPSTLPTRLAENLSKARPNIVQSYHSHIILLIDGIRILTNTPKATFLLLKDLAVPPQWRFASDERGAGPTGRLCGSPPQVVGQS